MRQRHLSLGEEAADSGVITLPEVVITGEPPKKGLSTGEWVMLGSALMLGAAIVYSSSQPGRRAAYATNGRRRRSRSRSGR